MSSERNKALSQHRNILKNPCTGKVAQVVNVSGVSGRPSFAPFKRTFASRWKFAA
jgi:hypothetical protein